MAGMNGDVAEQNGNFEKATKPAYRIKVCVDLDVIENETVKVSHLLKHLSEEEQHWRDAGMAPFADYKYFSEDSVKAIQLKLVRSVDELDDDETSFQPEMTYQLFGDTERVIGYHGLKIRLYYGAGSLETFLDMSYDKQIEENEAGDLVKDDVMKIIGERLEPGFCTNITDFTKSLELEGKFKPQGNLANKFTITSEEQGELEFEVYCADVITNPDFKSYNTRLQTFLLWYIEAASFVDIDDEKWKFFVLYEKYPHDDESRYAVAGFITVYEFYCYPNNIRPRISQMLILPPFQEQGLGAKLLSTVFRYYREIAEVTDISVESPSEQFQRLRDYVDCQTVSVLPAFAPSKLKKGFTKEMAIAAKEILKMNKKQTLRVCNILRLRACNQNNPREMKNYVDSLKQQVDKPHQVLVARAKRKKLFEKLSVKRVLDAMPSLNPEYRDSLLERASSLMLEQYQKVLERLERD